MDTAARYRRFAEWEAQGRSVQYEEWAIGVSADLTILELIDQLPMAKRQPNLIFAAARFAGCEDTSYGGFREWMVSHWPQVFEVALNRSTQTNEPGRVSALLPVFAALPGPLSIIEVGASAGLCLYPDRFSYRYDDQPVLSPSSGPSRVLLSCATVGSVPIPNVLPDIAYRAGVDINPLFLSDEGDARWLESLVWPEHEDRRLRLRAAAEIALAHPPFIAAGDLNEVVADLVAAAPAQSTKVVFHSAVLAYLDSAAQAQFKKTVSELPCRWLSNEGLSVSLPLARDTPAPTQTGTAQFLVSLDNVPLAYAGPYGDTLEWFGPSNLDFA